MLKTALAVLVTATFLTGCATPRGKGTFEDPKIPDFTLMPDGCYIAVMTGSNSYEAEATHMGEYCPVYDNDGVVITDANGRVKLKKRGGISQIDDTFWADVGRSLLPGVAVAGTQGGLAIANQALKNSGEKKVAKIYRDGQIKSSLNRTGGNMTFTINGGQGGHAEAGSSAWSELDSTLESNTTLQGVCTNLNGCQ